MLELIDETCFIYLTSNKISQGHQDHSQRSQDGHHDSPLLHLGHVANVAVPSKTKHFNIDIQKLEILHCNIEKAVATKEDVGFFEPD